MAHFTLPSNWHPYLKPTLQDIIYAKLTFGPNLQKLATMGKKLVCSLLLFFRKQQLHIPPLSTPHPLSEFYNLQAITSACFAMTHFLILKTHYLELVN